MPSDIRRTTTTTTKTEGLSPDRLEETGDRPRRRFRCRRASPRFGRRSARTSSRQERLDRDGKARGYLKRRRPRRERPARGRLLAIAAAGLSKIFARRARTSNTVGPSLCPSIDRSVRSGGELESPSAGRTGVRLGRSGSRCDDPSPGASPSCRFEALFFFLFF